MAELCLVCKGETKNMCGKCGVARYCSKEHQTSHWKIHKSECFPFRVENSSHLGRHLVASADIRAGDVIFSDPPIVIGPIGVTEPICLGCMKRINGSYRCPKCTWPMCHSSCQSLPNHLPECHLTERSGVRISIQRFDIPNPIYRCITPLRCLWLQDHDPEKWTMISAMEAHEEERKKTENYEKAKHYIVNIIRGYLGLKQFSEELIQRICGILEVNGYDIPRASSVALYNNGHLLEHSCIPNTTRTFASNCDLVVRAAIDLRKGEHIRTTYIDPLKGERIRKTLLQVFKYFVCSCDRCRDPTDLGTHLSSVRCLRCVDGHLPPPNDVMDPYTCTSCGTERDALEVEELLANQYEEMCKCCNTTASKENFLKKTQAFLSENHHYRTEVKLDLLQLYGHENEHGMNGISASDLTRKIQLCQEILELTNLFLPGLSGPRGIVLFHLEAAYLEKYKRFPKKVKKREVGIQLLQKIKSLCSESIAILRMEAHIREEMQMAVEAEQHLTFVEDKLRQINSK